MEHVIMGVLATYEPGLHEFIGEKLPIMEYVKQTATTSVHIPDVRKYRLLYLAFTKMSKDDNLTELIAEKMQSYLLKDGSAQAQLNHIAKSL